MWLAKKKSKYFIKQKIMIGLEIIMNSKYFMGIDSIMHKELMYFTSHYQFVYGYPRYIFDVQTLISLLWNRL